MAFLPVREGSSSHGRVVWAVRVAGCALPSRTEQAGYEDAAMPSETPMGIEYKAAGGPGPREPD